MPHQEVQAVVEKMYGVAKLIETDSDGGRSVFVFEVRTPTGIRTVRGWITEDTVVTTSPPISQSDRVNVG